MSRVAALISVLLLATGAMAQGPSTAQPAYEQRIEAVRTQPAFEHRVDAVEASPSSERRIDAVHTQPAFEQRVDAVQAPPASERRIDAAHAPSTLAGAPVTRLDAPFAQPDGSLGSRAGHGSEPPQLASPRPEVVVGELTTPRFRLLYTSRGKGSAESLSATLEAERDAFNELFGRDWPGVIEVRIGAGRSELEALALPGGKPPSWAIALAYPSHGIILLDALQLASAEGLTTLRHELAHVALGRIGSGWPRWFQEGLAQHLTGERMSISHYTALFYAVRTERILSFEGLTAAWPNHPSDVQLAYAQSAAFVAWLSERHGAQRLGVLLDRVAAGDEFSLAFAKAFQITLRMEEEAWQQTLPDRYGWMPWVTTGSLVLSLAAIVCVIGFVRRRRQLALRLAEMDAEEAAEESARRLLEAELAALQRDLDAEGEGADEAQDLQRSHGADASREAHEEGASDPIDELLPRTPPRPREDPEEEVPRRGKDVLH